MTAIKAFSKEEKQTWGKEKRIWASDTHIFSSNLQNVRADAEGQKRQHDNCAHELF